MSKHLIVELPSLFQIKNNITSSEATILYFLIFLNNMEMTKFQMAFAAGLVVAKKQWKITLGSPIGVLPAN